MFYNNSNGKTELYGMNFNSYKVRILLKKNLFKINLTNYPTENKTHV